MINQAVHKVRERNGICCKYPRSSRKKFSSWTSWPLKVGPIGCSETSLQNYHSMVRNIPAERIAAEAWNKTYSSSPYLSILSELQYKLTWGTHIRLRYSVRFAGWWRLYFKFRECNGLMFQLTYMWNTQNARTWKDLNLSLKSTAFISWGILLRHSASRSPYEPNAARMSLQ
jgi:hypothetical protein